MTNPRSLPFAVGLLSIGILGGCFAPTAWVEKSRQEFAQGRFIRAFEDLQEAKRAGEDAEAIDELWWTYRSASLLKRAQKLCFENQDVAALRELARVLAVEPDNRIALTWTRKCKRKLADRAATEGRSALVAGDLETALERFHEALTYWPDHRIGKEGVAAVSEDWEKRRDKAQVRYVDGVRALAEQQFGQTDWNMRVALDADPTLEPAEVSREVAQQQLADMRFSRAREMEAEGFYSAALYDYEAVAEVQPDREGLAERIEFVRREVEAQAVSREGEMALFRGEFAKARKLIDRAFEMSVAERPAYNDLLLLARDREFDQRYTLAKDLEYQGELESAVAKYAAIDEEVPGFRDVKARLYDLRASLEAAEESYKKGVAAEEGGDVDAALEAFREVRLFVPRFRDTDARIRKLEAEQGAGDAATTESEAPSEGDAGTGTPP